MTARPRTTDGAPLYRIQSAKADFLGPSYSLRVPAGLARLIGPDAYFVLEVTDDGLLFRKATGATTASGLPDWLR